MPPKIKIADPIDIIGFQPLLRETVKGLVFGSIEWKKSIGGIRSPSPEMAFQVNAMRVQEEFDHEKKAWVDLLSPAPVQKSVADTDGLRRVIFSVETGGLWKSLQLSVGWADETVWDYPEVMPAMGQAQFVDDDYSFPREALPGEGPWTVEPFRIELRRHQT
jgi:hypothetical protein